MAEHVHQNIEDMLPELEQMERVGLFTKDETRQILKKRQGYEYRLQRQMKSKEDYLQYIQYEINCLALLKRRREKTGYNFKRVELENAITERINRLFRMVTYRFQDDVKLWMSHIAFCESKNNTVYVGKIFTRMLQVHNKNPEIWTLAAKWEFENNNAMNARATFQRGLRFNPDSKTLWLEYYRMELLYTDKILKRKKVLGLEEAEVEENKDAVLSGRVAEVVYRQARETFPDDVELILSFIEVCQLFDFTQPLLDAMFKDLKSNFPDNPLTWHARAGRCFTTHDTTDETSEENLHVVYEQALAKINTDAMWELYIKRCIELVKKGAPQHIKQKRTEKLVNVFTGAADNNCLTEQLYLQWVEVLLNLGLVEKAQEAVKSGTKTFPESVKLWQQRLLLDIQTGSSEDKLMSLFKLARKKVPERSSWPLWEIVVDYLSSSKSEKLETVLEEGSMRFESVCVPIKEFYLNWTGLTSGIASVRKLYQRLQKLKPVSLDFYRSYLSMEQSQSILKAKLIRQGFEDAVSDFGSSSSDLWIDYIKFETERGQPESAGVLHHRAVKNLTGENNSDFITKYTLIQTGNR